MKRKTFFDRYLYFVPAFLLAAYYFFTQRTGVYDWEKEIFYVQFIKQSIFHFKTLPYYLWNNNGLGNYPIIGQGNLFIGNPETLLFSPWIFFLSVLTPDVFLKLFYLIHLLLGIIGILLLARKLNWDNRQLRIFSGLFLLSPIILQHIAIGYTPWINLFLFPLLMYFQFCKKRSVSVIGSAMVYSLIILQGGIHIAVCLLGFLILMKFWQAIIYKKISACLDLAGIIILTGLLAFARIYFSFIALHDFWQPSFPGFSIGSFMQMALKLPLFFAGKIDDIESYFEFKIDGLPYWDAGVYWGPFLAVVLFLLVYLIFRSMKHRKQSVDKYSFSILFSALGVLILSFGNIFSSVAGYFSNLTGLAAFEGVEKYPFRFSLLAYYGLSLWFAASGIQAFQDIHFPVKKSTRGQVSFPGSAEIRKRLSTVTAAVFFFLGLGVVFWFAWGRQNLLNEIRNAFYGIGSPLLEKMMANKEVLYVGAYLNKALTLLNWFICFMVLIMALCMIGFLYIKYAEYVHKILHHAFKWIYNNRMAILEILIIAPLGIASLSWMRAATATPVSRFDRTLVFEPELEATSPQCALIDISHSAPDSLHIKCGSAQGQACEISIPIKGSELRHFEIFPAPLDQIDLGDSQSFILKPDVTYQFNIDTAAFNLPVFFTLFNWLWASILLKVTLSKPQNSQV